MSTFHYWFWFILLYSFICNHWQLNHFIKFLDYRLLKFRRSWELGVIQSTMTCSYTHNMLDILYVLAFITSWSTLSQGDKSVDIKSKQLCMSKKIKIVFYPQMKIVNYVLAELNTKFWMLGRNYGRKHYHYRWVLGFTGFKDSNHIIGTKWRYHIRLLYVILYIFSLFTLAAFSIYVLMSFSLLPSLGIRYQLAFRCNWRKANLTWGCTRSESYWTLKSWFSRLRVSMWLMIRFLYATKHLNEAHLT